MKKYIYFTLSILGLVAFIMGIINLDWWLSVVGAITMITFSAMAGNECYNKGD